MTQATAGTTQAPGEGLVLLGGGQLPPVLSKPAQGQFDSFDALPDRSGDRIDGGVANQVNDLNGQVVENHHVTSVSIAVPAGGFVALGHVVDYTT